MRDSRGPRPPNASSRGEEDVAWAWRDGERERGRDEREPGEKVYAGGGRASSMYSKRRAIRRTAVAKTKPTTATSTATKKNRSR